MVSAGWKSLLGKVDEEDSGVEKFPPLDVNTILTCREGEIKARKTEPPKPFTEASLLQAMTGIARFVEDKELKKKFFEKQMGWALKQPGQVYWTPCFDGSCWQEAAK